jgi:hypothetical protein
MTTLARRRTRVLFSLTSALLAVLLASQSTLAAVSWTAPTKASPSYAYNQGMGLARTVSSLTNTPYLHQQYTYLNTEFPGVYYRRGNSTVSTWGTHVRANPSGTYAQNGSIAASSKYVYVAYQTVEGFFEDDYDPSAARAIGIRENTNHGSSTAWRPQISLSTELRVGRPAAAAYGTYAWVVYTDADTGHIVVTSNGGLQPDATWTPQVIGLTSNTAGEDGYEGTPVVAAWGSTVLVAWISTEDGGIVGKISTDFGVTWPDTATTLRSGPVWDISAASASGRFGLSWADATGIRAKLYRSGAWQSARTVASFTSTGSWRFGYGTAIALASTGRVGVAWSSCSRADCSATSTGTKGVSVRWRESTDNLATWKSATTVASYTTSVNRRYNDYPSVVFVSTPKRYIVYNVATADYQTSFYTLSELGTGKP